MNSFQQGLLFQFRKHNHKRINQNINVTDMNIRNSWNAVYRQILNWPQDELCLFLLSINTIKIYHYIFCIITILVCRICRKVNICSITPSAGDYIRYHYQHPPMLFYIFGSQGSVTDIKPFDYHLFRLMLKALNRVYFTQKVITANGAILF